MEDEILQELGFETEEELSDFAVSQPVEFKILMSDYVSRREEAIRAEYAKEGTQVTEKPTDPVKEEPKQTAEPDQSATDIKEVIAKQNEVIANLSKTIEDLSKDIKRRSTTADAQKKGGASAVENGERPNSNSGGDWFDKVMSEDNKQPIWSPPSKK